MIMSNSSLFFLDSIIIMIEMKTNALELRC